MNLHPDLPKIKDRAPMPSVNPVKNSRDTRIKGLTEVMFSDLDGNYYNIKRVVTGEEGIIITLCDDVGKDKQKVTIKIEEV